MTFTRHVSIARKTDHLLSLSVINNVANRAQKENYERRKMGKRRFGDPKSFPVCFIIEKYGSKRNFIVILLFAQLYRHFTL